MKNSIMNNTRICRVDAKSSFVECLSDRLGTQCGEKGLLRMNFVKYDKRTQKTVLNIPIFFQVHKILTLVEYARNGELRRRMAAANGDTKTRLYVMERGTSAKKLAEKGHARSDGKAEYRGLFITLSTAVEDGVALTAVRGPGREDGNLIKLDCSYNEAEVVMVPMSYDDFLGMLLQVNMRLFAVEVADQLNGAFDMASEEEWEDALKECGETKVQNITRSPAPQAKANEYEITYLSNFKRNSKGASASVQVGSVAYQLVVWDSVAEPFVKAYGVEWYKFQFCNKAGKILATESSFGGKCQLVFAGFAS